MEFDFFGSFVENTNCWNALLVLRVSYLNPFNFASKAIFSFPCFGQVLGGNGDDAKYWQPFSSKENPVSILFLYYHLSSVHHSPFLPSMILDDITWLAISNLGGIHMIGTGIIGWSIRFHGACMPILLAILCISLSTNTCKKLQFPMYSNLIWKAKAQTLVWTAV